MSFTGDKRRAAFGGTTREFSRSVSSSTSSSPSSAATISTVTASQTAQTATPSPADLNSRGRLPAWLSRSDAPGTSSSASTRFPFLPGTISKDQSAPMPMPMPQNDELLTLDTHAALFPAGAPLDGDAFSPSAFKNLQMNAEGLLNKFQTAYQQRIIESQELRAEHEAQNEEKDEVETRVHHLKLQLEDMARQAAERESVMQALMQELNHERRLRMDEQEMQPKRSAQSAPSTVSEDLHVEEDQLKHDRRRSTATAKSDLSLDTDSDSMDEESIFSRSRSPTVATSVSGMSPVSTCTPVMKPVIVEPPRPTGRARSGTQMTALQKLFKGMSSEPAKGDEAALGGPSSCRNCQGQDASMAWDTVNLLKDENKGLKTRVEELETAVEGALDAANGLVL